jgi:hypothetical protein
MKKKQAMDANMVWVVIGLLHNRENGRVPFPASNLSLSRTLVVTELRALSGNERDMKMI